ncbi:hypothetical protein Ancab_015065 [Ancistrocladus abbreviatus]
MAVAAAAASLSISRPASPLSPLPLNQQSDHIFTHFFPPNSLPPKPKRKPLNLIISSQNLTLSPTCLLSPLHLCRFSADFDGVEDTIDGLEADPEQELRDKEEEEATGEYEEDGDENGEKAELETADARRLYVGNLPYSMTSNQLAEVFEEAGQVQSVEIIYDRVTDRSRGFAFVTMVSVEEAKEAIRMFDGSQVGGRTVKVNFPEVPRGGERKVMGLKIRSNNQSFVETPHKIYAGNLGWGVTSQGLRDAFADQPGVLSAKVIYERETGRSRGFGFVTFSSAEEAESALNSKNGMEVEGRPLRLNIAAERMRSSPTPTSVDFNEQNSDKESEMLSSLST